MHLQENSKGDALLIEERDALFDSLTPFSDAIFYDNGDITLVTVVDKAPYVAAFETINKLSDVSDSTAEDEDLLEERRFLKEALAPFAQAVRLEEGSHRVQPIWDREPYIRAYFRWQKSRSRCRNAA